jgi:hypothetical protein
MPIRPIFGLTSTSRRFRVTSVQLRLAAFRLQRLDLERGAAQPDQPAGKPTQGGEMKSLSGTVPGLLAALATLVFLAAFAGQAQAATVAFSGGGTCDVVLQANGIRLDNCVNKSGKTANDLHVTFTHAGLPGRTLDIVNSFGCGIITTCEFGPDVKNGGTWEGIGGGKGEVANPTIWNAADIGGVLVNLQNVKATGNWTYDGTPIAPVPVSGSLPMALVAFGMLLALARRRAGPAPMV